MFFFFAGGVGQQVRQVLQPGIGRCVFCGSKTDLVEYNNVLKLFFVPVWKWPAKDSALYCNNCKLISPPNFSLPPPPTQEGHTSSPQTTPPPPSRRLHCGFCNRAVEPEFRFCPFCGSSL